ncbi:nucleic acid-binding, OB-fold-like protein isoform X2 [Tasmannia lanceolata]|uniref:nucleic acid-binding, OB-fold-like protein isoform X2 n=1 Tax=Tasmannia lanceolata TaxID=3420 RepID=UPI004063F3B3
MKTLKSKDLNIIQLNQFRKRVGTMDALTTCCIARFVLPSRKNRSLNRRSVFPVLASKEDPKMDRWDQMELKFGRLIGEDPKLTLAKIMGRRSNPDISYLDIEKDFGKNKGKLNYENVNVPLHGNKDKEPSSSLNNLHSPSKDIHTEKKLNLSRPIMKKGIKVEERDNEPDATETKSSQLPQKIDTKGVSNVTLRKPAIVQGDDIEMDKSSKLKIKPNLFLKMKKGPIENFRDIALLKKPNPMAFSLDSNQGSTSSSNFAGSSSGKVTNMSGNFNVSDRNGTSSDSMGMNSDDVQHLGEPSENNNTFFSGLYVPGDELKLGEAAITKPLDLSPVHTDGSISIQAALQGKPQRLDPSIKQRPHPGEVDKVNSKDERDNDADEIQHFLSTTLDEREDGDWTRAEDLLHTGERAEVELISCNSRGFVVSFGSLVGFLPYRNLGAKWKFLAFESWLRKKGLDPSSYKQNLSMLERYEVRNKSLALDSNPNVDIDQKIEEKQVPDVKLDDLLEMYNVEKIKFLSSFVGQRIKVSVLLADRNSRRLMFSLRPKEKEELAEKKRSVMAKLSIGDVVKCYIKKITYFGIFVEVEGAPALIHQSEVSWDATLDPSSYFKIGQIVEAKVHQLDFALERITLSLKEITPDPLQEALDSVIDDRNPLDGSIATVQADVEWADVESLIKELQQIEGIQSVSKGRFFLSPGLAPTFQVYMASMFENQYKLLARSGNKVQEVLVRASLDKEQMKAVILTCTNRVE